MEQVAFYILAFLAIVSALFMITRINPVHSALWMLLTFFSVAGIFVQLNAEFIAAIQVLVYAGAILVLYLFVVMLLNPKSHGFIKIPFRYALGTIVSIILVVQVFIAIKTSNILGHEGGITDQMIKEMGNVKLFGKELFTNYLVPFEVASILLLVAMIGAIVLAKKE
ncbi:NADH-quinone oxidoreductase subunit J [Deferribacter autotrophicus]|uniref:NADH-quinone oxidoreductase subunit J n=1 Tax=Deferribacter autotrophicus TaxID=500465 RepID=A0A5A8F778_9BACT|nr:NADH-quinone oxidoreductase subunit J [Deferribacter autotrophicus]KAA0257706.1 NADH-quinone oxidoreductase subunit J [Deferribacter autotrophicus]